MEFKEVIKNRYSCKKYSDRQVETDKLASILTAGRLAPTAKNLQEQHVYVLQSPESLAKIDAVTPCRYGAPTVLVVAFDKNNVFTYPERWCLSVRPAKGASYIMGGNPIRKGLTNPPVASLGTEAVTLGLSVDS